MSRARRGLSDGVVAGRVAGVTDVELSAPDHLAVMLFAVEALVDRFPKPTQQILLAGVRRDQGLLEHLQAVSGVFERAGDSGAAAAAVATVRVLKGEVGRAVEFWQTVFPARVDPS